MFKHVKLNESVLPKSLGVKGKNHDGVRYYTIDGVNMPSVTSILGDIPERKEKIVKRRIKLNRKIIKFTT